MTDKNVVITIISAFYNVIIFNNVKRYLFFKCKLCFLPHSFLKKKYYPYYGDESQLGVSGQFCDSEVQFTILMHETLEYQPDNIKSHRCLVGSLSRQWKPLRTDDVAIDECVLDCVKWMILIELCFRRSTNPMD